MQYGTILLIWLACMALPLDGQQAALATDFTNSVGVVTHFGYTDTSYYKQPEVIISSISKLGIRHIRDGFAYSWVAPHLYSIYAQLAQAKIRPDLIMPNPSHGGPSAEAIERLLPNYPGVEAIEGPNEYDQTKNPNWAADLRAFMPVLLKVGKDSGISVIGPSLTKDGSYVQLGDISADMDFNNLHAYWGGRNPETPGWGGPNSHGHRYGAFAYDFDQLSEIGPGRPVMVTESGYVVRDTPKQNVISESVEAIYEPRLVLHAWNLGVKRTYIYELMDDPSSPPGFGLLRKDLTPRPAFVALANLMQLLSDSDGQRRADVLDYSLSGHSSDVETTLLEKQDGSFWLALWVPGSIYEVDQLRATPVAPREVTISLTGRRRVKSIWKFDEAGNTTLSVPNRASVTLQAGSAITLLEIK